MTEAPAPTAHASAARSLRPREAYRGLGVAGLALVALGLVCLLAWATDNLEFIQFDSRLLPLHYNAGIGFLLWGAGYLAIATGRVRAARGFAVALAAVGLLTLFGSLPGISLRLDRWAFTPHPTPAFPPTGLLPGFSFALCLGAVVVLLACRPVLTTRGNVVVTVIGLFLVVGAPLTFLARTSWIPAPKPAPLGGIGVAIAGLPLLSELLRACIGWLRVGRTLAPAVGGTGLILTVVLWIALNGEQNDRIHRQVQFEAAQVQKLTQQRLVDQLSSVTALAEQWPNANPARWLEDVGSHIGLNPGCLGIAQISAENRVAWIDTVSLGTLPQTLSAMGVQNAVQEARREGRVSVTRAPRSFWNGSRVLVLFAPHRPGVPESDGLLAVYRLDDLLGTMINSNLAVGYAVVVSDRDEQLFARLALQTENRDRWAQTLTLEFRDMVWQLSVWPTKEVLERESLSIPKLALQFGLLTSFLLALAVHLAQTARRRTADLEREVHERELAQRALTHSEEKSRTLLENLEQGIFLQDRDGRYVAANRRFCAMVGRSDAGVLGRTDAELFDAQRAAAYTEETRTVLADGNSITNEEDRTTAGKRSCVRRVLTPVRDAGGQITGVLGIWWDVTEQRLLESHVHQASKMDAIGQLAGGIAHDFNNLLTAILGNLELLLADLPPTSRSRELAEAGRSAATRAASLTQRLLGFSRRHHLDWVPTDANAIVKEVVGLLRRTIDPLIRLETHLDPDLRFVKADPAQLNQVLMNLCLNARDAITGAGLITIETSRVVVGRITGATGTNTRAGEFIRIRVTDTGSGMTEEVKARIYEPFFTTKEVGKGTGLGLPMVFAIVREHKGWIDCWSEVGVGTRFDVYLPPTEVSRTASASPPTPTPRRTGKGTILVVDDEELIRQLAAATLRAAGYAVLEATDGQHAVDVYSREGDRISLVLLDLTMPVLSGHETFRHLLQFNSRVKVVFASGYALEHLNDLETQLMAGFLKKPYRPHELLAAVEEALCPSECREPALAMR